MHLPGLEVELAPIRRPGLPLPLPRRRLAGLQLRWEQLHELPHSMERAVGT